MSVNNIPFILDDSIFKNRLNETFLQYTNSEYTDFEISKNFWIILLVIVLYYVFDTRITKAINSTGFETSS